MQRLIYKALDFKNHVFEIQGSDEYQSEAVTFRVLDVQNKIIARDATDPTKVTCESVYFDRVRKDERIPDSKGGNACGRTFPVWEGRIFTSEDRQKQKSIAGYYTFLFGEVTFPGKSPLLVNLRLTGTLAKPWGDFQKASLTNDKEEWPSFLIEMRAKPQSRMAQFTDVAFSVKQSGLDKASFVDETTAIHNFINQHNDRIVGKVA